MGYTTGIMERLARLFCCPARLKVIRLFVFNNDSAFTLDDVCERTKLSKEAARREIVDLLASGLLHKKGERASAHYQVRPSYEHLAALSEFIRETTTVRPRKIIETLKRAGTLKLVALTGHFTGILEPQVDLLVVGDHLNDRILSRAVHALEADLGREIRYASFATADFRYRLGVYDRLLRDVFDYPHRLLIDKIGL